MMWNIDSSNINIELMLANLPEKIIHMSIFLYKIKGSMDLYV